MKIQVSVLGSGKYQKLMYCIRLILEEAVTVHPYKKHYYCSNNISL